MESLYVTFYGPVVRHLYILTSLAERQRSTLLRGSSDMRPQTESGTKRSYQAFQLVIHCRINGFVKTNLFSLINHVLGYKIRTESGLGFESDCSLF